MGVDKKAYMKAWYEANKASIAEQKKAYREANKASIAETKKAHYEANKASVAEKVRAYYEANKASVAEKKKAYYEANKASIAETQKTYRQANPDKINAKKARRRAGKLQATPAWLTKKHHRQILKKYAEAQKKTARYGQEYHVDHEIPLQGKDVCGLHVPWNLKAIPATENRSKGNRTAS